MGFDQAGLTPQMAVVNADGTPTMFFFRWLLAVRSGLLSVGDLELLEAFADGALDAALAGVSAAGDDALTLIASASIAAIGRGEVAEAAELLHAIESQPRPGQPWDRASLESLFAAPPAVDRESERFALEALMMEPAPAPAPVPSAPPLTAQIAFASASLTLTTAWNNVAGAEITVAVAGTYLVTGVFDFLCYGAGDATFVFFGGLFAASSLQAPLAIFTAPTDGARSMNTQQWVVGLSSGAVLQLAAQKNGGTGGSVCAASPSTMISAIRVA
ncbi:MAG TPA: hypothetical protein VGJ10_06085 [Paraburkholderia sp.]|jgi:hypothetical protein